MRTLIAVLLFFCLLASDASGQLFRSRSTSSTRYSGTGPYCNSPYCQMCANIRASQAAARSRAKAAEEREAAESAPTPEFFVNLMLAMAVLSPDDVVCDPGCGDARFLIAAAKQYGCKCVGFEIDAERAKQAQAAVKEAGLASQIMVVHADSAKQDLSIATVIVLYLFPETIAKLDLSKARIVLSYQHPIPDAQRVDFPMGGENHAIYVARSDQ